MRIVFAAILFLLILMQAGYVNATIQPPRIAVAAAVLTQALPEQPPGPGNQHANP